MDTKITFPPAVTLGPKAQFYDGEKGHVNLDGTPMIVPLRRLSSNDNTIRGSNVTECCCCSMAHLVTYEIFCHKNEFYLQKRSYSIKDGKKVR